ncbi:MAG: aminodeoxychorismate/anthranilate synthase component II [Candidatus Omnitrophica bacterium]|nr:Anthranilate synthase component 2 [bacterium]NUN94685.1 aminodeoxychorismate/anthranilate synthase component II [Candidatus Omnitrophota bacterium]
MPRIFILDNYDSFTFNLVQYLGELGAEIEVSRNDKVTPAEVIAKAPDGIVVSPGPCTPNEAGISMDLIREAGTTIPVLGVCLGHQSIGQVFGGKVIRAPEIMHGKVSEIHHANVGLFEGLENPFIATRYHSLIVERESLPDCLEVTAWTQDGLIMGLRHREFPIHGVQFHPESILTGVGKGILSRFLESTGVVAGR